MSTNNDQNRFMPILRKLICDYVKDYPVKVYLFGSRARNTSHSLSDFDIALLPEIPLPTGFLSQLKDKIDESTIPYSVDLIDLTLVDETFRNKILAEAIQWKD